jgi:hypothetical protein
MGRQVRPSHTEVVDRASLLVKSLNEVPRKATKLQLHATVPQTDTGARDEYSQALERTLEKELGKLTP